MPKEKKQSRFSSTVVIRNKKARVEFEFQETVEAGLVLRGSEMKSIREGKVSLQEAYCYINRGEMYIKGMNISPYKESTYDRLDPIRERKLLLHKRELQKYKEKSEEKGLTIVPTKLYINNRGFAKIEIALAKGKKLYDKRESLKKKDQKKEMKDIDL